MVLKLNDENFAAYKDMRNGENLFTYRRKANFIRFKCRKLKNMFINKKINDLALNKKKSMYCCIYS